MKNFLLLGFTILLFSSCQINGDNQAPAITFSTNRNLIAPLEITPIGETRAKEVQVKSSEKTVFSPDISERTLYMLKIPGQKLKAPLSLGVDEIIEIQISDKTMSGYQIKGSPESEKLARLHEAMLKADLKMQQHMLKIMSNTGRDDFRTTRKKALKTMESVRDTLQHLAVTLIHDNPGALSNIIILQQTFGEQTLLPVENYAEIHKKVATGLTEKHPNHSTAQEYRKRILKNLNKLEKKKQAFKNTQPGNKAPNLTLPGKNNKSISLYDLRANVLLVFWKPDDKENITMIKRLKEVLDKHKKLHIYAVSIHPNTQLWEKTAPETDRWVNVTEPNGLDASSVKTYGIESTPVFILLGENQTITARSKNMEKIINAIR